MLAETNVHVDKQGRKLRASKHPMGHVVRALGTLAAKKQFIFDCDIGANPKHPEAPHITVPVIAATKEYDSARLKIAEKSGTLDGTSVCKCAFPTRCGKCSRARTLFFRDVGYYLDYTDIATLVMNGNTAVFAYWDVEEPRVLFEGECVITANDDDTRKCVWKDHENHQMEYNHKVFDPDKVGLEYSVLYDAYGYKVVAFDGTEHLLRLVEALTLRVNTLQGTAETKPTETLRDDTKAKTAETLPPPVPENLPEITPIERKLLDALDNTASDTAHEESLSDDDSSDDDVTNVLNPANPLYCRVARKASILSTDRIIPYLTNQLSEVVPDDISTQQFTKLVQDIANSIIDATSSVVADTTGLRTQTEHLRRSQFAPMSWWEKKTTQLRRTVCNLAHRAEIGAVRTARATTTHWPVLAVGAGMVCLTLCSRQREEAPIELSTLASTAFRQTFDNVSSGAASHTRAFLQGMIAAQEPPPRAYKQILSTAVAATATVIGSATTALGLSRTA